MIKMQLIEQEKSKPETIKMTKYDKMKMIIKNNLYHYNKIINSQSWGWRCSLATIVQQYKTAHEVY